MVMLAATALEGGVTPSVTPEQQLEQIQCKWCLKTKNVDISPIL